MTHERIFEQFKDEPDDPLSFFRDVSTFGGCAGSAAAALENLRILEEEGLVEHAAQVGDYLQACLRQLADKHAVIGDVRGKGLLQGVELVSDRAAKTPVSEADAKRVVAQCKAQGVLIGVITRALPGLNTTLCLAPPLILTRDEVDELCGAIDRALATVFG
ncbi:aminotransferase [Bordetella parapertussis]|nr:aminotransferase [Bordetella parapertussis]